MKWGRFPSPRPTKQFSLWDLCLSVSVVAFLLAGLGWLGTLFSLNPHSEVTIVLGEPVRIPWKAVAWEANDVGGASARANMTNMSQGDFSLAKDRLKEEQRLFYMSCDDYFGSRSFFASVSIDGSFRSKTASTGSNCIGGGAGHRMQGSRATTSLTRNKGLHTSDQALAQTQEICEASCPPIHLR